MHKTGLALAVSHQNANKLYVSLSNLAQFDNDVDNVYVTGNPDLLYTLNASVASPAYVSIMTGLPNRFVTAISVSPTFDDSLVVVLGGYGSSHVWISGNRGTTWTSRGAGLPDCPFNTIIRDKNNPNVLYAGCDMGVYVSNNLGQTWWDFNAGFQDAIMVYDLQITADNKIVAASHGKGAWISNLANATTLPNNILEFSGFNKDAYNELNWDATNESMVDHYELERSIDGGTYAKVGNIKSKNTQLSSYTYDDPISSNYTKNTFFYRIKTVNKDGSYIYSNVVIIKIDRPGNKLVIFGNPVTSGSSIQLTLNDPQRVVFKLYDIRGRLVSTNNLNASPGANRYSFSMFGQLAAGHYVLEAITEKDRFTQRFVVTK
jgi:hypothetical protein